MQVTQIMHCLDGHQHLHAKLQCCKHRELFVRLSTTKLRDVLAQQLHHHVVVVIVAATSNERHDVGASCNAHRPSNWSARERTMAQCLAVPWSFFKTATSSLSTCFLLSTRSTLMATCSEVTTLRPE